MEDTPAAAAGSGSSRRTRTWGAEASRRTAMLHQLCAIRRGEIRASDAIQVKVDGLIYDTVPEEEYNALVARRRKEAGEFIIDNDGLGYIEDGHRTRTRGVEASLQRLRAVRSGEIRASDAVQVKVDAPIYDTVPEEEYNALVARRRKEAAEFIIDDDGLGYVEDWSHRRALPPQAKSASRRRSSNPSRRAAAAKTGAQQISSMFTSSVFIKRPGSDRAKSLPLAADSIVDAVIAEFAPDEDDREERRRRVGRLILAAEMVRSDNGNDMTVELKNDAEMETNLEEISGSSGS